MIKIHNIQSRMTTGTIMIDGACFDRVDGVRQAGALWWRESVSCMGDMHQATSSEGSERTVPVTLTVGKPVAEDGSLLQ
jgi:hypothetical protein